MTAQEVPSQPPGFSLMRVLSEREGSRVYIATQSPGSLCAVKIQVPKDPTKLPAITARYDRIQPLTSQTGLVRLLAHGVSEQRCVWEAMPLADNLPGLPLLSKDSGLEHYTPLTLRARTLECGRASAGELVSWGVSLAKALGVLHAAGLVHRDVKPANILFFGGEPQLGDYGLVGEPGAATDFSGTEGFQPLEGTNDFAADLFALGKTLYEAWTGQDRLEFPSLPRSVLDSAEWKRHGRKLNEVILRACHGHPNRRFQSAAEFQEALEGVLAECGGSTRRRWLIAASTGTAGLLTVAIVASRWSGAPARVLWRRVRKEGFSVESWDGPAPTADWNRRRVYSLCVSMYRCTFTSLNVDDFTVRQKPIADGPVERVAAIYHPVARQLWAAEGGTGEVFAFDPDSQVLARLGGKPHDKGHYNTNAYWDPVTRRIGVIGGYGNRAVRNDRHEFDDGTRKWIQIEPDRRETDFWPRVVTIPPVLDPTGKRLFLVGGHGSPSGKQGDRFDNLQSFNGQFYHLEDIWELDLTSNQWRQLLPTGWQDPQRLRVALYHPVLKGLILMYGLRVVDDVVQEARTYLFRPDIDHRPCQLPTEGEASILAQAWTYTADPETNDVLIFATDGIFRVTVRA